MGQHKHTSHHKPGMFLGADIPGPRRGRQAALIAAAICLLLLAGLLVLYVGNSRPAPNFSENRLSTGQRLALQQEVRTAMMPTGDPFNPEAPNVNYEHARDNLEELARKDATVKRSRYYALNMFEVCMRLKDEACMQQNARTVKSLSTADDPYDRHVSQEIRTKIEEYAK